MKKSNEHCSTRNPSYIFSIAFRSDRTEIGRHLFFSLILFSSFSHSLFFSSPFLFFPSLFQPNCSSPRFARSASPRFHFQDDSICSRFRVTYRGSKLNAILDEASDERWVVSWTMERSSSIALHQTASVPLSLSLSLSVSLVRSTPDDDLARNF